ADAHAVGWRGGEVQVAGAVEPQGVLAAARRAVRDGPLEEDVLPVLIEAVRLDPGGDRQLPVRVQRVHGLAADQLRPLVGDFKVVVHAVEVDGVAGRGRGREGRRGRRGAVDEDAVRLLVAEPRDGSFAAAAGLVDGADL